MMGTFLPINSNCRMLNEYSVALMHEFLEVIPSLFGKLQFVQFHAGGRGGEKSRLEIDWNDERPVLKSTMLHIKLAIWILKQAPSNITWEIHQQIRCKREGAIRVFDGGRIFSLFAVFLLLGSCDFSLVVRAAGSRQSRPRLSYF